MFHHIPPAMLARMQALEQIDSRDRHDGTPDDWILRQIPPETGRFIALLAANTPPGNWLEIGTSAGYSTLWLALACRQTGRQISTIELMDHKVALARETFRLAGVEDIVTLIHGDALTQIQAFGQLSFCFLDAYNRIYADCYETLVANLVPGGLLVADNAVSHGELLQPVIVRALSDERVDAMIFPIGKGELICRRR